MSLYITNKTRAMTKANLVDLPLTLPVAGPRNGNSGGRSVIGHLPPQQKACWNRSILQALLNCKRSHKAMISNGSMLEGGQGRKALALVKCTSFGLGKLSK